MESDCWEAKVDWNAHHNLSDIMEVSEDTKDDSCEGTVSFDALPHSNISNSNGGNEQLDSGFYYHMIEEVTSQCPVPPEPVQSATSPDFVDVPKAIVSTMAEQSADDAVQMSLEDAFEWDPLDEYIECSISQEQEQICEAERLSAMASSSQNSGCWVLSKGQAEWPAEHRSAAQISPNALAVFTDGPRCSCASSYTATFQLNGMNWAHTFNFTTCTDRCGQCGGCISCHRLTNRGDCGCISSDPNCRAEICSRSLDSCWAVSGKMLDAFGRCISTRRARSEARFRICILRFQRGYFHKTSLFDSTFNLPKLPMSRDWKYTLLCKWFEQHGLLCEEAIMLNIVDRAHAGEVRDFEQLCETHLYPELLGFITHANFRNDKVWHNRKRWVFDRTVRPHKDTEGMRKTECKERLKHMFNVIRGGMGDVWPNTQYLEQVCHDFPKVKRIVLKIMYDAMDFRVHNWQPIPPDSDDQYWSDDDMPNMAQVHPP